MSGPISYFYECPKCGAEVEFDIEPLILGRYGGPPENCYPDEGGYADGPDECEFCHTTLDAEKAYAAWEASQEPEYDEPDY